jgi:SAM-dependent methyltransferase
MNSAERTAPKPIVLCELSATQTLKDELVPTINAKPPSEEERIARILQYYAAATNDYEAWSPGFNMHFGYWRFGLNPFRREAMLQELSRQSLKRLNLPELGKVRLADLGGGTGATARLAVDEYPFSFIDVVTIAPNQIEIGERLNRRTRRGNSICFHCVDYEKTKLPTNSYDGVCLIESGCHAEGVAKETLFREIFRLLKPGSRFVMVDAMLKGAIPHGQLSSIWRRKMYDAWCQAWAVPELAQIDSVRDVLKNIGFEKLDVEDWSYRIAPSVAHAPFLTIYYAIKEVLKARKLLSGWRWNHLVASFLSPWIGVLEPNFVYVAISATKCCR